MWDMFFLRVPRYLCLHLNALQQAMTYYVNSRMALKIFLKNKEEKTKCVILRTIERKARS